ncbi:hypothetical protein LCGC14_2362250, partial [marine sediment metagenome]
NILRNSIIFALSSLYGAGNSLKMEIDPILGLTFRFRE